MSEKAVLPEKWNEYRVKDILSAPLRDFGSFSLTNLIEFVDDGIPFIKSESVKQGYIDERKISYINAPVHKLLYKSVVRKGDILYTKIGALGRVAIYDGSLGECNSNAATVKINVDKGRIDPLYFTYLLMSEPTFRELEKHIVSTPPRINLGEISALTLLYPPLQQQQKIAKILSTIDNLIEKTQTLIEKYTAIKQGMMADLFTRGIDMTTGDTPNAKGGKLRPSVEDASELYKQTELGWVPKEWGVCSLSSCLEFLDSKRIPLKQEDRADMQGHYRYFGASGVIDYVNDYIFDGEFILLGEDGENVLSRNVPLAFKVKGKIWVNNHAHIMVPANNSNIDYFTEYLESLNYENLVSGSAQPKITQNQLAGMLVRVPTLFEQAAIAEKLYSLNKKIEAEAAYLEKLSVQKKGLMQDLLTGRLEVQ